MKSPVNPFRLLSVLTLTLLVGIMIIPNLTRNGMTKTRLPKAPTPMMSTIIVTTTANTIAADGQCSLREAIINANNDAATHADCAAGSGADTIVLQASTTYTLAVRDNTEYGYNGLPAITSAITIEGNGATIARGSGVGIPAFRFIHITSTGNLTLRNVALSNGLAQGGNGGSAGGGGGGGGAGLGGAIYNRGMLTAINSTLNGNQAAGGNGGIAISGGGGGGGGGLGGHGGSTFNASGGGGGGGFGGSGGASSPYTPAGAAGGGGGGTVGDGVAGSGTIGGSGGNLNGGKGGDGGNVAQAGVNGGTGGGGGGGGNSNFGTASGGNGGFGGGGGGASGGAGNGASGGSGGFGGGGGGAGCAGCNTNTGGGGGGNGGFGGGGAGGYYGTGGVSGFAGGKGGDSEGGNLGGFSAGGGGGGGGVALGGAIFNDGGTVTLTNSTISTNTARGGAGGNGRGKSKGGGGGNALGAGVYNHNGTVTAAHCTFTDNILIFGNGGTGPNGNGSAGSAGGGAVYSLPQSGGVAVLTLTNNILANSSGGQDASVAGTINGNNNLIESNSGVSASVIITTADPLLGPLTLNAPGNTPTHALLVGSPAIDQAAATVLTTDQRGATRPIDLAVANPLGGNGSDLGAYEYAPPCSTISLSPTTLPNGLVGVAYSQTITASGGTAPYTFTVTSGSLPSGLTLSTGGVLSGTPTANGTFNFTVTAADAIGCTGNYSYTLTIANTPPDAVDDTATTNEDTAVTVSVLANDTDMNGNTLSISSATVPANGNIAINGNGTITYTPNANFHSTDSFGYTISDGNGGSDTATVTVNVAAVNDAPDAVNDSATTAEDTAASIIVLGNDTDIDGNTLTVSSVTQGTNGLVVINANGTLTYTPNANFNGSDSFTYTVSDGAGGSDTATVSVTITAVNDAPVATNNSYNTNEDTALNIAAPGVLSNDSDLDNTSLSVLFVSGPANGSLQLNADGSFTYSPNANFNGSDSFTYKVNDGAADSNTATVSINVQTVNDAPSVNGDAATVAEDGSITVDALANDTDADGDTLAITAVTQGANGTATINTNGTVTYTPNANFNGTDSFSYTVSDGNGGTATATVTVSVTAVNDAPTATTDSFSTNEDVTLVVAVPGVQANDTDVDGNPLTVTLIAGPASGTLTLNADGSFSYMPAANFFGTVNFTYKVNDGTADSAPATTTITVSAVNDPPGAVNDAAVTNQNTAVTISVFANDTDIESNTLSILSVTQGANGAVVINANGTVTYTPNINFFGNDAFTYTVSDGNGGTDTATVSVTVNLVNSPPTANAGGPYTVSEGSSVAVSATGSDPENGSLSFAWDLDNNGSFETPGQSVSFSAAGLDGLSIRTIKVQVTDSGGLSTIEQATVTVQNVAPNVGAITASIDPIPVGSNVVVNANFTDAGIPDTHTAQWTWDDGATSSGTVTEVNGSGAVTGNHTFTATGVYEIKLRVTDDDGDASEAVFQYVVVYDPQGGFVTGGGWINSPVGAYLNNPALTGKANFGFVSKYLKGANVPTGNTEFQFKAGNLNFHSTSYDWLVVAGHKAQYKGSGRINNAGDYAFMLTATDGQQPGGGGTDKFRIKIWDKATGQVIYDNKRGASDDIDSADPQAISGGSIVIHKQ